MTDQKNTIESYMKLSELKGKKEMVDKYSDVVAKETRLFDALLEHNKNQEKMIVESCRNYLQQMHETTENAKEFCENKTVDELKEYLANQPVAYNLWKDADRETLVDLIMSVYGDDL